MFINPNFLLTVEIHLLMEIDKCLFIWIPKQEKYQITINIPEGYLVESVPKPIKVATVENVGVFIFTILPEGKRIQIS
jgi:hypothetical protein